MIKDPRFIKTSGRDIFTGNELLVKGALEVEGGVHLLTGYPGSPIAPFFDTLEMLAPLLDAHGMVAKMANNEALSAAMVNGAQMAGLRAITAFKSVGMHVASDALALTVLAGTHDKSGGLIICGDDPWSDSTQVAADSRFLAEHIFLPMIEPSTPQEMKDWVNLAFKLGYAGKMPIGYLVTTATADGGGTVTVGPNHFPKINEHQKRSLSYAIDIEPRLDETVLLPPRTGIREQGIAARHDAIKREARKLGINRIQNGPQKGERVPLGLIAVGHAQAYLEHALSEMNLTGRVPILKIGMPYPLDEQLVIEFAQRCDQVIVIEQRRSFVERRVHEIISPLRQAGKLQTEIYGKQFPTLASQSKPLPGIPETLGLNPSILIERLVPVFRHHPTLPIELTNGHLTAQLERITQTATYDVHIPSRTPAFCPGCPHRDSSSVLLELRRDLLDPEYMLKHHKRKPVDMVAHGDTGCYTMLMFEPNKPLMHNYSGMGLGGGTGSGVDPFIDNKQLVFMGDGTFFHSGQVAISHSISAGQDITYIILDNKTTAMTGHQGHAAIEHDLMGRPRFAQNIERIAAAMVPKKIAKDVRIVRINPADRTRYRQLLEQTILADGVKIVIADKECGITFHRRAKSEQRKLRKEFGFLPTQTFMNVATEVCEYCLECTTQTGCPGLTIAATDYGPKIQTDQSWCVNDGACHRIHACPSFEEVTIHRGKAPRQSDEHFDLNNIPEPPRPLHADQDTWRAYLAGVGGMGIGLCTAILTTAGHLMGYDVQFLDKKGLAIRNGGVFSQLVYNRAATNPIAQDGQNGQAANANNNNDASPCPTTPLIPYGKADLLLGIDLLECVRALDPKQPYRVASPAHTSAVVNTAMTPTILSLMGVDRFDPNDLEATLRTYTHPDHFVGFNVGDLCERILDSKLYANIMMLGIAFQKGYLPVTADVIEQAIRTVARSEVDRNLRAFAIGRMITVRPDLFVVELQHEYESSRQTLRRKLNLIRARRKGERGQRHARRFRVLMKQTLRATRGRFVPDDILRDVIVRAYDCYIWGGVAYAEQYCTVLQRIFKLDLPEQGYRITRAVVWNLAKAMLIKDEIYVASLLTNPEKYKRDRRRFSVNPTQGDRIVYRHHNRPEFDVLGKRIRFEWKSRDWQLRLMARCTALRKLLPQWHTQEKAFRDWYIELIDRLDDQTATQFADHPAHYARWAAILNTPANVTGYREVRYPKMVAARRETERLLKIDPDQFTDESSNQFDNTQITAVKADGSVSLPLLQGV